MNWNHLCIEMIIYHKIVFLKLKKYIYRYFGTFRIAGPMLSIHTYICIFILYIYTYIHIHAYVLYMYRYIYKDIYMYIYYWRAANQKSTDIFK